MYKISFESVYGFRDISLTKVNLNVTDEQTEKLYTRNFCWRDIKTNLKIFPQKELQRKCMRFRKVWKDRLTKNKTWSFVNGSNFYGCCRNSPWNSWMISYFLQTVTKYLLRIFPQCLHGQVSRPMLYYYFLLLDVKMYFYNILGSPYPKRKRPNTKKRPKKSQRSLRMQTKERWLRSSWLKLTNR